MTRTLTPYEITHLARFGKSDLDISQFGEMPVEYMTGKVEFCDTVFSITQETLIPRIESEELIDLAVQHFRSIPRETVTIADVGCGCGAIGISIVLALHQEFPGKKIELVMSDISAGAVEVAKNNATQLLPPTVPTTILVSDLLTGYAPQTFNLLVANLPYIPSDRLSVLDKSVTEFEPHLALDGGPEGLSLIHQFLKQSLPFLTEQSLILLEIDYTHTAAEIAVEGLHVDIKTVEDQFHRTRFALVTRQ